MDGPRVVDAAGVRSWAAETPPLPRQCGTWNTDSVPYPPPARRPHSRTARPRRMEQQRDPKSHAEEDHLAGNEDDQLPTRGARERMVTDPAADEFAEIINQLPLDGNNP